MAASRTRAGAGAGHRWAAAGLAALAVRGSGSVGGTVVGAALIGVPVNRLVLNNVSPYMQQAVIGLILIAAVAFERWPKPRTRALREIGTRVLEDMDLIGRGLPPVACRRAERETVARLRSMPVSKG